MLRATKNDVSKDSNNSNESNGSNGRKDSHYLERRWRKMKPSMPWARTLSVMIMTTILVMGAAFPSWAEELNGGVLFRTYCYDCHRSLVPLSQHAPDLLTHVRNPVARMPGFSPEKLSDKQVQAIADYIIRVMKAAQ